MGGQEEMTIQNIIKKLRKNGITNYEIIPMASGCDTVSVPYINGYDLTNIVGLFKTGVKIDISSYTRTVILWNYREWERSRKLSDRVSLLVELFYTELRTGKTPEEAKQTQHEYAKTNNMLDAFYRIYK
jgi:hypothetical protein